jgi:competence protein ComEA
LTIAVVVCGITLSIKRSKNDSTEIILSQVATPNQIGEISIDGAVDFPGIYYLNEKDTIQSLLADAGIKSDADLNHIEVYIPSKEQKQDFQRIDINRAEIWLLQALPGIGESRAQAIVDYRSKNGHFNCTEDILLIKGFGEVTFDKIKDLITVSE